MDGIEKVMDICVKALEDAGYEITEYSSTYQNFTAINANKDEYVSIDFDDAH